jgi:methylenetetrahydrofolate dehydrogenase (NADP+)/methenyltetrahydrofolate cyclohydrolase
VSFNKQGKAVGDVRVDDVLNKVRFVTPTPGGVGPITVAVLLHNTVVLAEYKNSVQKK